MISRFSIGGALVSAGIGLAAAAASAQVSCGGVVTSDTVMQADLLCPFHDPALTVQGPATLDMNGRRIFGDGAHVGVELAGKGATVKNGAVVEFGTGVRIGGIGGHRVHTVVSKLNTTHGFAITSSGNRVEHSLAFVSGANGFLIFSFQLPDSPAGSANENVLTDNVAMFSGADGFQLGGNNGRYKGNVSTNNDGNGFRVYGARNSLIRNTSQGNDNGFEVSGTGHQLYENVSADARDVAFRMPEATDKKAKLVRNVALLGDAGFQGGTILTDNVTVASRSDGIAVSAPGASIVGNTVVGAEGTGIVALGGDGKLTKNRTLANQVGVLIGVAPGTTVAANLAIGNDLDLVDLDGSCTAHVWTNNVFATAAPACVH